MRICLIANLSDQRCGFQNFALQTITALQRAGHQVTAWDGTYTEIYRRHQEQTPVFFPADIEDHDVVHLIWHAATMNHYSGADWAGLRRPIVSWWDGGPSDASCPFLAAMQVRWSDYPREGYEYLWYPVPDWVPDLPEPAAAFTVGSSSVRGDGIALLQQLCERHGWGMNLPTPGAWIPLEAEVRRLARSTVNVCWYHTPPLWKNRASAPSMMLAAQRPLLINRDPLVAHLFDTADIYHGADSPDGLDRALTGLAALPEARRIRPRYTARDLSWAYAMTRLEAVWQKAMAHAHS